MNDTLTYRLGFIGAGNMAEAIARAAIDRGVLQPGEIIAYDPTLARRELFASLGIAIAADNEEVIARSQQVMLAIKPQMLDALAPTLKRLDARRQVVISIMAGIRAEKIAASAGLTDLRIVRVMPNMPVLVGQGMAGIALGHSAQPGDDELAIQLFEAGGKAIRVAESDLDAITAVSGSGPAYLFYLAEAMERAAAELGLAEHARLLVSQTLLGAATLLAQSPDTAAELRRKVTSPGGTTEAAIRHLDTAKVSDVIVQALHAAHRRSQELGR